MAEKEALYPESRTIALPLFVIALMLVHFDQVTNRHRAPGRASWTSLPLTASKRGYRSQRSDGLLLFIVSYFVADLFAFCIGSARGDRAGFAIGGHNNPTGGCNLSIFFDDHCGFSTLHRTEQRRGIVYFGRTISSPGRGH